MITLYRYMLLRKTISFVIPAICTLLLACARTPTIQYYQLSAMSWEQNSQVAKITAVNQQQSRKQFESVIGIGPIRIPEYLDRPQIITRIDSNQLQLEENHRWAEPLVQNITWVVKENLALLLENNSFQSFPWPISSQVDKQLIVDIIHFEGHENGTAQLAVVWKINNRTGETLINRQRKTYQSSYTKGNYSEFSNALSKTLTHFCIDIAEEFSSQRDK